MVAWGNLCGDSAGVDVLQADRAIGPGNLLHALVCLVKVVWQTHIAGGAVEVIFATANPADSTSCAVKLLLVFVVIELAVKAEVLPELEATVDAVLVHTLASLAVTALHSHNILPCECVVLLFVMTEPAAVEPVATGGHKHALPLVVLAEIAVHTICHFLGHWHLRDGGLVGHLHFLLLLLLFSQHQVLI